MFLPAFITLQIFCKVYYSFFCLYVWYLAKIVQNILLILLLICEIFAKYITESVCLFAKLLQSILLLLFVTS